MLAGGAVLVRGSAGMVGWDGMGRSGVWTPDQKMFLATNSKDIDSTRQYQYIFGCTLLVIST